MNNEDAPPRGSLRGTASFPSGGQRSETKRRGESLATPWKCPVYADDYGKKLTRRDTTGPARAFFPGFAGALSRGSDKETGNPRAGGPGGGPFGLKGWSPRPSPRKSTSRPTREQ